MTLAAQLVRRRLVVGASAARRGSPRKVVPLAAPPRGAIVAYTGALLSVSDELDAAIHHELVQARVIPRTDGAADGESPAMLPGHAANVAARLQRVVDHILSKRSLLSVLDGVAGMTASWSKQEFAKQVRAVMGVDLPGSDPHFGAMFADFRAQNVAMIKSLAADKVSRVHKIFTEAGSSTRVEEIATQIRAQTDATKARAALIARDQVLSLNAQVTQKRHQAAGITSYIWRTSRDERVRAAHKALEGQQFTYGEPPIVDPKSGRREEPGQGFQCRCTAEPVIDALITPVSPEVLSTLARAPQVPVEAPPLPTLQAPATVPLPPEIAQHMAPTISPTLPPHEAPPAAASKPNAPKKPKAPKPAPLAEPATVVAVEPKAPTVVALAEPHAVPPPAAAPEAPKSTPPPVATTPKPEAPAPKSFVHAPVAPLSAEPWRESDQTALLHGGKDPAAYTPEARQKSLDGIQALKPKQMKALKIYSGKEFKIINGLAAQPKELVPPARLAQIEHLNDAIDAMPKAPADVPLFRGIQTKKASVLNDLMTADEVDIANGGFVSTSRRGDVAVNFSQKIKGSDTYSVIYRVVSHKSGALMESVSQYQHEAEVLFKQGTKFRIVGRRRLDPLTLLVDVEEV